MHPDIMLELMNQHAAELRSRAQKAQLARLARLARVARKPAHARRHPAEASGAHAVPEIPDYVDAMFGATGQHAPTGGQVPGQRQASSSRRAA